MADAFPDADVVVHRHRHKHVYPTPETAAESPEMSDGALAALLAAQKNSSDPTLAALMASQGGGLGGNGLLGGLVLASLLGRNGLFGNSANGCIDGASNPAVTAVNQASIQEGISDIKASIPLTACQTQGEISSAAADINSQALQQAISAQKNIADQSLAMQMGFAGINANVTNVGNQNVQAFNNGLTQVLGAISQLQLTTHNEGELTRNLINSINTETLNRQLSDANTRITELMADRRADENRRATEINVSQISNQVATQQATQQAVQQQQILAGLNGLLGLLGENNQLTRQTASIVNLGGSVNASQSPSSANTRVN